jgi:hypothetical protein
MKVGTDVGDVVSRTFASYTNSMYIFEYLNTAGMGFSLEAENQAIMLWPLLTQTSGISSNFVRHKGARFRRCTDSLKSTRFRAKFHLKIDCSYRCYLSSYLLPLRLD